MPDQKRPTPLWKRLFQTAHILPQSPGNPAREARERQLLARAAAFASVRVADVMVPRADIVGVEIDTPLEALARLFAEAQHSRLPVYRETLDDPLGFVHIKEVMTALTFWVLIAKPPFCLTSSVMCCLPRPLCLRRICCCACKPCGHTWRWWSMNSAAQTVWSH